MTVICIMEWIYGTALSIPIGRPIKTLDDEGKVFSLALVPSCFVEISTLMFGHQTCVIDCVFFRNQIWIPSAVIVVLRPPQMK